ncbi:OSTB protein, partial [Turnix velox]|nr:OSTB protein [Turnix velox]
LLVFFADTEAFLLKNAKVKLCLQASSLGGSLLMENCDPESQFQDWFWHGDSLKNHGTQTCLSMVGSNDVQMSPCSSVGYTSWDCSNSLLSPLGNSQAFLVASKKGVTLNNFRGLKAQWQDAADRSVCEEKAAWGQQDRYFTAALASTQLSTADNVALALGMDQAELEELLWFFRREDPSAWNYSVLALSFVAMILGLLLLSINVMRNRKRKIYKVSGGEETTQKAELEVKQALMPVQDYSPAEPQKQEVVSQDQKSGDVMVQWKDGTVTSLYAERPEDPI